MHENYQGIRRSGVGDHHHNRVAENAINNMVIIARTMMIHTVLSCPNTSENALWPMSMSHAVHLQISTPLFSGGLYPEEVWESYMSSHIALQNSHPWVCPVYVLGPRLQGGNKFPKWMPMYRVVQCLGAFPLHAITLGLVRNLNTGNIIPQFHLVFDDYLETLHAV